MPINNNILVNKLRSFISDKAIDKIKKFTSVTYQLFKPNYWTISIIFLFILFTIFDAQLYSWIQDKAGKILSFTYFTIAQYTRLNWALYITIIFIGYSLLYRKAKDLYISVNQILIILFALYAVFNSNNYWIYSKTPLYIFTYGHLIIAFILLQMVAIYFSVKKRYITAFKEKNLSQGFAIDTPAENVLEEEKPYWRNFCSRLLQTDISKEPFSVGIVGDWGSGKTTVLNTIQEELEGKAYIIEFNPWYSHTPQQILTDFFKVMQKSLKDYYSPLSNSLSEYLSVLADIDIDSKITKVSKLISSKSKKDINTIKEELQKCLNTFEKPIIVFIDDLDRLEANELFEVLRLIRNTAKFSNMIFISAYDRNYLEEMLQSKNVASPSLYIEKIFNMEIVIPTKEFHTIRDTIITELQRLFNHKLSYTTHQTINYCCAVEINDIPIINLCLNSHRAAKRFTNQFTTSFNNLLSDKNIINFNIEHLFFIELLRYINYNLYNILSNNPYCILHFTGGGFYFGEESVYSRVDFENKLLQTGIKKDSSFEASYVVLKHIFGEGVPFKEASDIYFPDNYYNYFAFRVMNTSLSYVDFQNIINEESNIEFHIKNIRKFRNGTGKDKSIILLMQQEDLRASDSEFCQGYLKFIIYWYIHSSHENKLSIAAEILSNKVFHPDQIDDIKKDFFKLLDNLIDYGIYSVLLAHLFSALYRIIKKKRTALINNFQIMEYAQKNFERIIKYDKDISFEKLFVEDSDIKLTIDGSITTILDQTDRIPMNINFNLILNPLIELIETQAKTQTNFKQKFLDYFSSTRFIKQKYPDHKDEKKLEDLILKYFNEKEIFENIKTQLSQD